VDQHAIGLDAIRLVLDLLGLARRNELVELRQDRDAAIDQVLKVRHKDVLQLARNLVDNLEEHKTARQLGAYIGGCQSRPLERLGEDWFEQRLVELENKLDKRVRYVIYHATSHYSDSLTL
jgi:ribosomal protein L30/L7E